jgi:ElaB/YqjD/DUF883 family membrane-anchored ribosome-binding protein
MSEDQIREIRADLKALRDDVNRLALAVGEFTSGQRQMCAAEAARVEDVRKSLYHRPDGVLAEQDRIKAKVDALCLAVGIVSTALAGVVVRSVWVLITGKG